MALPLSPRTVEQINEVMARSDFSEVTPEAILAALEAEGISSLEELARSLTEALRSPDGRPERVPFHELFSSRAPDEVQKQSRHGIPTVHLCLTVSFMIRPISAATTVKSSLSFRSWTEASSWCCATARCGPRWCKRCSSPQWRARITRSNRKLVTAGSGLSAGWAVEARRLVAARSS